MNRKRFEAIASLSVALILVLDAGWQARALDHQMSYPSVAPLDQSLMDRNAEIAIMCSACGEEGSSQPLVLTRRICDSWRSCESASRILLPSRTWLSV